MPKVLIIGPNYFNFLSAVSDAFRQMGWEAVVEGYDGPVHPYRALMRFRYKLSRNKERLKSNSRQAFSRYMEARFHALAPDLVFIMNGDMLLPATLDVFRVSAKVAVWLYDNRVRIPSCEAFIDHSDAFFCFDPTDVAWFVSQGKNAFFLPQACDTTVYRPLDGMARDIDILFIGDMYVSPRRKQLTTAVAARFPDRKVVFYGRFQPWYKGFRAWLLRPYKRVFKNRNVSSQEANRLYNRARVVLNIHQEHQRDGANPRVFEICGAGAWQVCDRNPFIAALFPEGTIGLYENQEELFLRIEEALARDMSARAAEACRLVRSQHAFRNRMEEVLRKAGLASPGNGNG